MQLEVKLSQGVAHLIDTGRRVIHHQHLATTRSLQQRIFQQGIADPGVERHNFGKHFLDVNDLNQTHIFQPGNGCQVMRTPGTTRRRLNGIPVEVHDPVNGADKKSLHGKVVLSDDDGAIAVDRLRLQANRTGEVDHRDGLPTQVNHANDIGVALGHLGKNFANLKHIEREQLRSGQLEQQNFQPVFAYQTRALINRIQNPCHNLASSS